jgi:hypothetical protein
VQVTQLVDEIRAMTHILTKKISRGHPMWNDCDNKLQGELLNLNMTMKSLSMYETRHRATESPLQARDSQTCWQPHDGEIMYRQLMTLETLLEMCNRTFERVSSVCNISCSDKRSLTQLASDIMSQYCQQQNDNHWQEAVDTLEEKTYELNAQSKELFESNERYCKAATSLKVELDAYAARLDARATLLKKSYLKYCEVMQEWGVEPSTLGLTHDELLNAQAVHETAWEQRETIAASAGQIARENGA